MAELPFSTFFARLRGWPWRPIAALLLVSLTFAAGYRVALIVNGNATTQWQTETARRGQAEQQLVRLRSRLAIVERGTDVTGAANRQLRDELEQMEQALDASRSDLEFYRRLLSAGLEKGLDVHELVLSPTSSERVFRYRLTLALNSRHPGMVKGAVDLVVHGITGDQPRSLDLAALLADDTKAAALEYEFRYFQQLAGDLVLPQDFVPERVTVMVRPAGPGDLVEREFDWSKLFDD